jgi:oxygen-independent coproporphyrinogen-3 oxidase
MENNMSFSNHALIVQSRRPLGIYISIPFCRTKCSYCNFASDVFSKGSYENYVVRLLEDIGHSRRLASNLGCTLSGIKDDHGSADVDSIYIGGGTPSILEGQQLLRIFAAVRKEFAVAPEAEITVECAPGTLSPALLETLLLCGVNRVSLGVQSFVDQEAQSVGRLHKRSVVLEEIARLRSAGIANINVDLIAGLPHQTAESWEFSLAETIATGAPHVSVYMLEVDDDSRLGRELIAGGARYHAHFVPEDDETADFYQRACDVLWAAGIAQYEISNFARTETNVVGAARQSSEGAAAPRNNQSRHNLKYWTRQPYLGFGVDAHSMLDLPGWRRSFSHASDTSPVDQWQAMRFATPDSLDAYMNRVPHTLTPVSAEAAVEESFILGLRLNRGVDLEQLRRQIVHFSAEGDDVASATTTDPLAPWHSAIELCIEDGLLEQEGATLRLTARGRLLSNEVFGRFLAQENKVGTGHVNSR